MIVRARLPSTIEQGHGQPADRFLPLIYDELHRLAAKLIAQERPGEILEATALVNEVYLRLVGPAHTPGKVWRSREHFFAVAAETMRRILIENARWKRARRHGGGWHRVPIDTVQIPDHGPQIKQAEDILAIDETLDRFAAEDPVKAELVRLRFFAGLSVEEAARVLGISRSTAARYWQDARVWLLDALTKSLT